MTISVTTPWAFRMWMIGATYLAAGAQGVRHGRLARPEHVGRVGGADGQAAAEDVRDREDFL
jgi:hypothetical protein